MKGRPAAVIATALAVILCVVAVTMYLTGYNPFPHKPKSSGVTVNKHGGTYHFSDGVIVTVPAGAVSRDTELKMVSPTTLSTNDGSSPLQGIRQAAVRFDLAFANGIEPAKPLQLQVPLAGKFLPQGANPQQALLYTPNPKTSDHQFIPITVDARNVLHAQLAHLSPKDVVFGPLGKLFDFTFAKPDPKSNCNQQVTTKSIGKVKLTGARWSLDKKSPVRPCLTSDGDTIRIKITNNAHIVWTVGASQGVKLSTFTGDIDAEVVQQLARVLINRSSVKGFLSRDTTMTATTDASNIPAYVKLDVDGGTSLVEALWIGVKFLISLTTGENSSKAVKLAHDLIEKIGWQTCLHDSFESVHDPSWDKVLKALVSNCGKELAKLEGADAYFDVAVWNQAWNRVLAFWDAGQGAWSQIHAAYDSIRQTIDGPVVIQLASVAPACAGAADFSRAVMDDPPSGTKLKRVKLESAPVCEDGWAFGAVSVWLASIQPPNDVVGFGALLHWVGGRWVMVEGGQDTSTLPECSRVPPKIYRVLNCA